VALKTKIDVTLEAVSFQATVRAFDKFALEVRKSPMRWKELSGQIKAAERTASQLTRVYAQHSIDVERASIFQKRFADDARHAAQAFTTLARGAKSTAESLGRAASSLLSVTVVTGAIGGLLGFAGGLFGADELSRAVSSRRKTAMGLGVGYGQLSSLSVNLGRFGDVESQLGAVSGGLYDYTNPAYTALLSSGARPGSGKNAADELLDLYQRLPGLFANTPDSDIGPKAESMGLTQIMSVKEIIRFIHSSPDEQRTQIERARADQAAMAVTPEAQLAWAKFNTALARAGLTIETILADQLVPLAPIIEKFSDAAVRVSDALSRSPLIDDALSGLEQGLGWFSNTIAGPEFEYGAKRFLEGVLKIASVAGGVLSGAGSAASRLWQGLHHTHNSMNDPVNPGLMIPPMRGDPDYPHKSIRWGTWPPRKTRGGNSRGAGASGNWEPRHGSSGSWGNTAPDNGPSRRPSIRYGRRAPPITDISNLSTYPRQGEPLEGVSGFIWHHTGGRGTPQSVVNTLNQRGYGVQYVMDRSGNIYRTLPAGSRGAHILPSEINNLTNSNTEGMEVIANDDTDITPAEVAAARKFARWYSLKHPGVQYFGHGEVNPSHKMATEGHTIVEAVRNGLKPVTSPSAPTAAIPMAQRTLTNYMRGDRTLPPVYDPSIVARQKSGTSYPKDRADQKMSHLDQYQGAKTPKMVVVVNETAGSARVDLSRQAYG